MKSRLESIRNNTQLLAALVSDIVIPEGLPSEVVSLQVDSYPAIEISCGTGVDLDARSRREQTLDLAGQWFGKIGWVRDRSYDNNYFHWKKQVGFVHLTVRFAEVIPLPIDKTLVPPSAFPILLE